MRSSGILMHITSLPGPYGVGTMGKQAFAFVDFLKAAGQKKWQILPLTPTGYGDSPYQSCSAFAGNHYLIDLDLLVDEGLLKTEELTGIRWCRKEEKADFGLLYQHRLKVLRLAYSRFDSSEAFDMFCTENENWLSDFALFMALKSHHGGKPWYDWEEALKHRRSDAMEQARTELADEIRFYSFVQYLFFRQWKALHTYANENEIEIIGDVPIYVPLDSVEVWSQPELFELDETLNPIAVAGCPPDGFTEDGQLWGNPLYRWNVHQAQGYKWWLDRLAAAGKLYDVIRLDHFRGFEAYWSVPYGDKTARYGKWVKGPGISFVKALKKGLPDLPLIAEDLGFLTQEVLDLRDAGGWPGMKVLQFAFDPKEPSDYLPHTYVHNSVCYTGTHDNMPLKQWLSEEDPRVTARAIAYMGESQNPVWGMIRMAFASVAELSVVQLQDYLELGGEGRMNFPGTASGNWTWRARPEFLQDAPLSERIKSLTRIYGRLGGEDL